MIPYDDMYIHYWRLQHYVMLVVVTFLMLILPLLAYRLITFCLRHCIEIEKNKCFNQMIRVRPFHRFFIKCSTAKWEFNTFYYSDKDIYYIGVFANIFLIITFISFLIVSISIVPYAWYLIRLISKNVDLFSELSERTLSYNLIYSCGIIFSNIIVRVFISIFYIKSID